MRPKPHVQGMRLHHTIFAREERLTIAWRLRSAMMLSEEGYDRRCIMALTVQQIQSVAHLSLVLGVLRRLEVATVLDRLIPPHLRVYVVWTWGRHPAASPSLSTHT